MVVGPLDKPMALFYVGGEVFASNKVCPHRGDPLANGRPDAHVLVCPWPGWTFEVRTGRPDLRADTAWPPAQFPSALPHTSRAMGEPDGLDHRSKSHGTSWHHHLQSNPRAEDAKSPNVSVREKPDLSFLLSSRHSPTWLDESDHSVDRREMKPHENLDPLRARGIGI
jgi:Rieske [2Fe-2S] domain